MFSNINVVVYMLFHLCIHTMDKPYNLTSTKRDSIQIPVQVLCSDSEFSSKIGGFSNSKQQVTSSKDLDMRDSLACLSPMTINSVFSGFSLSFTPAIQFWTHVRHSVSSAKLESKFLWSSARYILVSSAYRWWVTLKLEIVLLRGVV